MIKNKIGTVWISGLTASGKTTLGNLLFKDMNKKGIDNIIFLDGDQLRELSKKKYGRSLSERYKILKKYIELVRKENEEGKFVIISTVSHQKKMREIARKNIVNFMEVNLECSKQACSDRDYKGLYEKSKNSKDYFPGVTEPYQFNKNAELILDTEKNTIEVCRKMLLDKVFKYFEF